MKNLRSTNFSEYYKQALRAIELGISEKTQPMLFLYKDFYLEHMKNIFLQKESASTFCHPKMDLLLRYEQKHNSDFAHTFYMYLLHKRNHRVIFLIFCIRNPVSYAQFPRCPAPDTSYPGSHRHDYRYSVRSADESSRYKFSDMYLP